MRPKKTDSYPSSKTKKLGNLCNFQISVQLGYYSNCFPFQVSSVQSLSHVRLFVTPWTAACQASLSIINLILSRKQSLIVQSLAQFFSLALLPLLTFQTFVWYSPLLLSGACILLDAISNSAPCILISNHSVIYTGKPSPFLSIYVKYQCRNDV